MIINDIYFVDYRIETLVLSTAILDAMVFDDLDTAIKFKEMLLIACDLKTSVSIITN